jgi:hypothetical protein
MGGDGAFSDCLRSYHPFRKEFQEFSDEKCGKLTENFFAKRSFFWLFPGSSMNFAAISSASSVVAEFFSFFTQ